MGYKKINKIDENLKEKILLLGILMFIVGIFTYKTFITSDEIKMILLFLTITMFTIYYIIDKQSILMYKLEIMWFSFFMYFLLVLLYQKIFYKVYIIDVFVFFVILVLMLLAKLEVKNFKFAFNIILIIGIIYSFSSLLQYFNIELYTKLILSQFTDTQQESIMNLYDKGNYTGLTWQTAYISGYIIYGIAIVLFTFKETTNKLLCSLLITALPILFTALILGGKRAHLLFMVLALLITYLFSAQPGIKSFLTRFLKTLLSIIGIIILGIVTFKFYTPGSNTPVGKLYNKINSSIEGLSKGEDITSGRTILYEYAIKLFRENPILGVGWRRFEELSFGLINSGSGSHPHNIYLQLLAELGIVGFVLFMIPVVYTLFKTLKLLLMADILFSFDLRWKTLLQLSLFSQVFFLLYGITGNLLTDHMYILMWAFSASITLSAMKIVKESPVYELKIFK